MTNKKVSVFQGIRELIDSLKPAELSEDRISVLNSLVECVQQKVDSGQSVRINFICTHNSRRSHLSQVWAQTMAAHFGIEKVFCYSGGTEATALFPVAASTLKNSGFEIETLADGGNPIYAIKYAASEHPIIGFSKKFDDAFNPKADYVAVMTCSHADENCPFIPGAEKRIPITYEDPKAFDATPQQAEKYHERSLQIATEMCYVFSQVKSIA